MHSTIPHGCWRFSRNYTIKVKIHQSFATMQQRPPSPLAKVGRWFWQYPKANTETGMSKLSPSNSSEKTTPPSHGAAHPPLKSGSLTQAAFNTQPRLTITQIQSLSASEREARITQLLATAVARCLVRNLNKTANADKQEANIGTPPADSAQSISPSKKNCLLAAKASLASEENRKNHQSPLSISSNQNAAQGIVHGQ